MPRDSLYGPLLVLLAIPAWALDPGSLAPAGEYVSLDTHRLHYHCQGTGSPAVVIDGGIGSAAVEWRQVQAALSVETRVCTYDRAGYAWSDPGPSPRTTSRTVAELRKLLDLVDIAPPHVLVGHSFGGFTMRYFAAKYPREVAGLVLVESSHPAAGLPRAGGAGRGRNPFPRDEAPEENALNEDFAVGSYLNSRRKAIFAQMDEMTHFATSARQVEEAGPLPDIPLRVIARDPRLGFPEREAEAEWQSRQRALSRLTPQGHLVVAAGSGHEVHGYRPDLVIAEVRAVLALVKPPRNPADPPRSPRSGPR